jgi:hypothetical protein
MRERTDIVLDGIIKLFPPVAVIYVASRLTKLKP